MGPLESKYAPESSYCYGHNNPIKWTDPTGMGGENPQANEKVKSENQSTSSQGKKLSKGEIEKIKGFVDSVKAEEQKKSKASVHKARFSYAEESSMFKQKEYPNQKKPDLSMNLH